MILDKLFLCPDSVSASLDAKCLQSSGLLEFIPIVIQLSFVIFVVLCSEV